jgi:hypothetical protein
MHAFCPVTVFAIELCGFSLFTLSVYCAGPSGAASKAWVCGRSLPRIAGSSPTGAGVSVFCEVRCVVR